MSALAPDLASLQALLATGAAAQEANMTYIADLEGRNQKQAADIAALQAQITNLQAQQKQAANAFTVTPAQAEKYAGILVDQHEIAAGDKAAAAQKLIAEPHRIHGVLDKLASLLSPPTVPRNGQVLPRGGQPKFAGDTSAPKEIWFAGQTAQ